MKQKFGQTKQNRNFDNVTGHDRCRFYVLVVSELWFLCISGSMFMDITLGIECVALSLDLVPLIWASGLGIDMSPYCKG